MVTIYPQTIGKSKGKLYLAAAFFIPFIIMAILYAFHGVFPFGDNSILVLDMNAQYITYFEAFRDAFFEGKSLVYSWGRTLGGEMLGLTAYYLASPYSFLVLLFPETMITEAVFLMTLLKIGSAGLTFALYLRLSRKTMGLQCVLFSTMYALMSYMVVQAMNIMWIDGVIFLPVILLGLEQLISHKKFLLFTISLAITFIANYYIGYMIGIFCFLYFLWYAFTRENEDTKETKEKAAWFFKRFALFMGCALLAVMLAAFILLPVYYSLSQGKFGFSHPNYMPKSQFPAFDLLPKFLMSTYDTVRPEGLPIVYCGLLTVLIVPVYFLCPRIRLRKKIFSAAVIAAMVLSFNVSTLDLIWHGFQGPNWLPYRYSFTLCFFLLTMASDAFRNLRFVSIGNLIKVYAVLVGLIIVLDKMDYEFAATGKAILLSLIFLTVYVIIAGMIITMQKRHHYRSNALWTLVLLAVVMSELFVNGASDITLLDKDVVYSTRPSYRDFVDEVKPAVEQVKEMDTGFYRIEKTFDRTVNDPLSIGFNGISHSSSTLNAHAIGLITDLGFSTKSHWTKFAGGTELTNSFLGIKYILSKEPPAWKYDQVGEAGDISIYENPYPLPIVFGASLQTDYISASTEDPFIYQNELLSALLGVRPTEFFYPIEVTDITLENAREGDYKGGYIGYVTIDEKADSYVEFELDADVDEVVYCYFPSEYKFGVNLWLNGEYLDTYFENTTYRIVELGNLSGNEENKLRMTLKNHEVYYTEPLFYSLDANAVNDAMAMLASTTTDLQKHGETRITATVTTGENGIIMTTIPYETGWHLTVDGEEVETFMTLGALLAARVEPGTHQIELHFLPKELVIGIAVSSVGLAILVLLILLHSPIGEKLRTRKAVPMPMIEMEALEQIPEQPQNEVETIPEEPAPDEPKGQEGNNT